MRIKWVSFFTPAYKAGAVRLMESLDRFGQDFDVSSMPDFPGTGQERFLNAVRAKPAFMFAMLQQYADYDYIVWTDADSEVQRPPVLLQNLECDVAVRYLNTFELLSGTMMWRCCGKVMRFFPAWIDAVTSEKAAALPCPEQQVLQAMLPQSGLDICRLPEEYVYVASHQTNDKVTEHVRDNNSRARRVEPVIYHYQASREIRNVL